MKRIAGLLLVSALLGVALSFLLDTRMSLYRIDTQSVSIDNRVDTSGRIVFVGDVMLARDVERKMDLYGLDYPFINAQSLLLGDAVVGNFEAAVPSVHVPTPSMVMQFSVPEDHVPALAEAGFTHMSLANNHTDDYGVEGFTETERTLETAGVVPFGSPFELSSSTVTYVAAGDTTVALIGVYAVVSVPKSDVVAEVVADAAEASDVQIAYVHWGEEYGLVHDGRQEALAHLLIDAGVDVVIGHHPHVVQDIQTYNDALIFYSLGNFIFDQYWNADVTAGLVLDLAIQPSGELVFTLVPVSTQDSRTSPRPQTGFERETFLAKLAERSDATLETSIKKGVVAGKFSGG